MYATEYVKNRAAFARPSPSSGIQWEIAKCATEIEAARLLTYGLRASPTREVLEAVRTDAVDVQVLRLRSGGEDLRPGAATLGAAGYMEDHPTEQYYRDARPAHDLEGTSQVQLAYSEGARSRHVD